MTTPAWKYKAVGSKDDTLPCKRQALNWENVPMALIQGFQDIEFFGCSVFFLLHTSVDYARIIPCSAIHHYSMHYELILV